MISIAFLPVHRSLANIGEKENESLHCARRLRDSLKGR